MAYGVWRMAYGVWRMAYGVWRMAYGVWRMAYGVWRMAAATVPPGRTDNRPAAPAANIAVAQCRSPGRCLERPTACLTKFDRELPWCEDMQSVDGVAPTARRSAQFG
jgi:hypothetical protein